MDENYDPGRYVRMNKLEQKVDQLEKQKKILQEACRRAGAEIKKLKEENKNISSRFEEYADAIKYNTAEYEIKHED